MGSNSPLGKRLALKPVEASTPAVEEARPAANESPAKADPQRDLRMTTADEFLAAAAKEYESGNVDRILWRQAADRYGRDVSLVIAAYLRARATALQLRHKADAPAQIESPEGSAEESANASSRKTEPEPRVESEPTRFALVLRSVPPVALYTAGAVAALASAVAIAYLVVSLRQGEAMRPPVVAAATSLANAPASPAPLKSEQLLVTTSNRGGANESGPDSLASTVRELKIAGNWNVLVLYANEWTRKEPNNPVAWRELSVGYANLKQFNDALDAATKAVQLSPGDALPWRNLGQINLAVDRLPEAAVAFGRALAVNPDDADARCGAALVAQRQAQPKDPNAVSRRVGGNDSGCPDVGFGDVSVVSAGSSAARKPVPSVGR
jgi:tetratricopeptide (TPR) repeat protein